MKCTHLILAPGGGSQRSCRPRRSPPPRAGWWAPVHRECRADRWRRAKPARSPATPPPRATIRSLRVKPAGQGGPAAGRHRSKEFWSAPHGERQSAGQKPASRRERPPPGHRGRTPCHPTPPSRTGGRRKGPAAARPGRTAGRCRYEPHRGGEALMETALIVPSSCAPPTPGGSNGQTAPAAGPGPRRTGRGGGRCGPQ